MRRTMRQGRARKQKSQGKRCWYVLTRQTQEFLAFSSDFYFLLRQDLIQPQLASNSLYAAEDDIELLVLWSAGITVYTPHLIFAMLGIKLGASCMSGKGSTD